MAFILKLNLPDLDSSPCQELIGTKTDRYKTPTNNKKKTTWDDLSWVPTGRVGSSQLDRSEREICLFIWNSIYLRYDIHEANFIFGHDGLYCLQTCPIEILLIFPVFYKPKNIEGIKWSSTDLRTNNSCNIYLSIYRYEYIFDPHLQNAGKEACIYMDCNVSKACKTADVY